MTNEAKKRLLDVVGACEAIAEFVAGIDFATYESNRLLRSAVERQFEIIGEALNKAGAAEISLAAQIPEFHRIIDCVTDSSTGTIMSMTKSCGTSCRASWLR